MAAAASTPPARSRSTSGGGPPPACARLRSLAASRSSFLARASAKASSGVGGAGGLADQRWASTSAASEAPMPGSRRSPGRSWILRGWCLVELRALRRILGQWDAKSAEEELKGLWRRPKRCRGGGGGGRAGSRSSSPTTSSSSPPRCEELGCSSPPLPAVTAALPVSSSSKAL